MIKQNKQCGKQAHPMQKSKDKHNHKNNNKATKTININTNAKQAKQKHNTTKPSNTQAHQT